MGSRGANIGGALSSKLKKIEYNSNWLYQPDEQTDLKDMRKNPIKFVGVGDDTKLGYEIEDDTIQTAYHSKTKIDISKLETLQPFVLASGVDNYKSWDDSERPYVVQYKGRYIVLDGNHRIAQAKLRRQKQVEVDISVRKRR